jgi:hypothetical protein
MEIKDKEEFMRLLWLFANDAGVKISKEQLSVKFEALKKYSIEQVSAATDKLIHHRRRNWPAIPSTSELVESIEENPIKTQAQFQCDIILKYFKYYGRACEHRFKNPSTRYLMENRWSFYQLGNMDEKDLKWFRRDFVEAFTELEEMPVPLIDIAEKAGMIPADNLKRLIKSADLDGHCSGAIISLVYPDCELIGINYGDEFPWGDTMRCGQPS